MNKVLITGANKGIGFGISKHLAFETGRHDYRDWETDRKSVV